MSLNKLVDLRDIHFVLFEMLGVDSFGERYPMYEGQDRAIYEEFINLAERIAVEQVYPVNAEGDKAGCTFDPSDNSVRIPACFHKPLDVYYEAGFPGISIDPDHGGAGMPESIYLACFEILSAGSVPFMMYPGLSIAAMHVIRHFWQNPMKDLFIEKMMSGIWGGTMCLTEASAGSDVGLGKSKAVRNDDDTYRISGQNIFISSAENDYYENMIHLKLARIEGDPAGTKGLSLFVVPKFLVNPDGSIGKKNDVVCAGIEHKMGIRSSATCTMSFGESGSCTGYLIGQERQGMKIMFHMMNEARLGVSVQGLSLASSAYLHAATYAKNRLQGSDIRELMNPEAKPVTIINHPDVKRMLLWMKSHVEGMRFLSHYVAYNQVIHESSDGEEKKEAGALCDLLLSVAKAGNTDTGLMVTSEAIQVYGGYGYCSDYPVEQLMRDARIFPVYEGTNGIQSQNLAMRQILMNKDQYNYSVFKKRINKTISSARGIVDDKYINTVELGLKKFDDAVEMMKEQLKTGKFIHLFMECTQLQQAMHMLCLAWGHLWALTTAAPAMKKITGELKGEERDRLLSENNEAAYYTGRVLSAQFYIGSVFPVFFGKIDSLLGEESAVLKTNSSIFTGSPAE